MGADSGAEVARAANPNMVIAVRTHSAAEQSFFEEYFATPALGRAVYAEREAALSLAHYSLLALGRADDDADLIVGAMRDRPTAATETFKIGMTTELRAPATPG